MQQHALAPRPLAAERSPWLRGTIDVPGDTVISHLSLALAALARGESTIAGLSESRDVLASVNVLQALGARVEKRDGSWHVAGLGTGGLLEPQGPLECGGSTMAATLAMGLAGTHDFVTQLPAGILDVPATALAAIIDGLGSFGTSTEKQEAALVLHGPTIALPTTFRLPPGEPSVKAALLLAALAAPGASTFIETASAWDHAERLIRGFGGEISFGQNAEGERSIIVGGLADLRARRLNVAGDPSVAAAIAVAASILPGSEIRIGNVLMNGTRIAPLSALLDMGADLMGENPRIGGAEDVADLVVRHVGLRGASFGPERVGELIDDLPLVAVAAAFAEGETVFELPATLSLEARSRIATIVRGLRSNGVACDAGEEAFAIRGTGSVRGGGRIVSYRDPILAMAGLVLGMAASDQVTIDDQGSVEARFPNFLGSFENIGASFVRYT